MAYSAGFSQQFLVNSESFVGDLNQSIYGFTGGQDALDTILTAHTLPLTTSWRPWAPLAPAGIFSWHEPSAMSLPTMNVPSPMGFWARTAHRRRP